ncbi:MAG: hypothetical protein LBS05_02515 [Tannerellaceae bacterium]|jgi:hypothetical protein|nr:hypothetical protein [Tannerellaceae bacterium]
MKHLILLLACVYALPSCSDKSHTETGLSYTLNSFSAPLTSLGLTELNDSLLLIGTEHGNVLFRNIYTDRQEVIDAGHNRVYDIKEYSASASGKTLLASVRDEGLKAIYLTPGDEKIASQSYTISGKGTNYGVYTIHREDDGKSFALETSNGDFTLQNLGDTLRRRDSLDLPLLPHRPSLPAGAVEQVEDSIGGTWTIYRDRVAYLPAEGDKPVVQQIPEGVSLLGRHITCASKDFVYLAAGDHLYTFPVHQNLEGVRGSVIALGRDTGSVYLLSGDYTLYEYNGQSPAKQIGKVHDLEIRDNIVRSEVRGTRFYIATDKMLYKIHIPGHTLLGSTPVNRPGESRDDIRSLFYDNDTTLYVGTRFNLYVTNPSIRDSLRYDSRLRDPENDLYVTAFCRIADTLYVGTLNKGVFAIVPDGRIDTLIDGNPYGNIRSLPVEEGRLHVYTSHGIYRYAGRNRMEPLAHILPGGAKYIRSVVADAPSSTVAIAGNHGFAHLQSFSGDTCRALSYHDITFSNATLAFAGDSSLIIGNPTGLYQYKNGRLSAIPLASKRPISWAEIAACLFFVAFIIGCYFFIIKYPQERLRERLNDFLHLIENLKTLLDSRVIVPTEKEELLNRLLNLRQDIEQKQKREDRYISLRATNAFSDTLKQWEEDLGKATISHNDPVEDLRLKVAKKIGLNECDLEYLEFLSDPNYNGIYKDEFLSKRQDNRQKKIAIAFGLRERGRKRGRSDNKNTFIVDAAYKQGLLIIPPNTEKSEPTPPNAAVK